MAAYTHLSVNANAQSLTDWVDAYNLLITDINATGLRLGATLIGNGVSSVLTIANTDFQMGNTTANVVLSSNGSVYISGNLTVGGTIVGASIGVANANTTANGLMSMTTQSFAGVKTFTENVAVQGTLTATTVVGNLNASALSSGTVPLERISLNAVTFNNGGAGVASGTTYTGASAITVSYNTVGAPAANGASATGTWGISITGNAGTVTDGMYLSLGQSVSGRKGFSGGQSSTMNTATGSLGAIEVYADATVDTTRPAFMTFHRGGQAGTYFGLDSDGQFKWGGWSYGGLSTFLHSNNYSSYALPLSGGTVTGVLTTTGGSKIGVQNGVDGGSSRGLFLYQTTDPNWGIYMAQSGSAKALNDGTAAAGLGAGRTSWHVRFRAATGPSYGFLWENNTNVGLMSLATDTGNLHVLGSVDAATSYASWFRAKADTGLYFETYGRGIYSTDSGGCSFGNVQCYGGGRNGWAGYAINTRHVYMSNGSTQSGLYDTSVGWVWSWDGSSISSTYNIHPHTTDTYFLGSSTKKWKSAFFNLTAVASGSSVVTDTTGELLYISSSARYKTDIRPLTTQVDPLSWLAVEPIVYRDKARPEHGEYYGFLAEDVHDKGFTGMVVYDEHGRPNSLMYDRATVFLTAIVKRQQQQIAELEARISQLE